MPDVILEIALSLMKVNGENPHLWEGKNAIVGGEIPLGGEERAGGADEK
jgi:hypothetical protein